VLFRIVDQTELWVIARVPEQDAARLQADRDAAFRIAGLDTWQKVDVTGEDANARVVTVGRTIDSVKRTVDVIYSLSEPADALRVGGLLRVSLPVGREFSGVVVPASALLRDGGREFLYVQVDGEHFEERLVKTGPRAGDRVGISSGVEAGERIVVEGANLVRVADRPSGAEPHGHVH
jgi:multidrug efflux pump subunit AcrA (membrane-fusion protein)